MKMKKNELKECILQYFKDGYGQGIKHAITAKDFCIIFYGVNTAANRRAIGAAIELLRQELYPICSNDNKDNGALGYYIPATRQEADTFFRSAKARARKTFISTANVAKALNMKFGVNEYQMELSL